MSIIGPTTRNASRAVSENCVSPAATNASASEHTESTTARPAMNSTATGPEPPPLVKPLGNTVWNVATSAAPMTRKPPACTKSVVAVATNVSMRRACVCSSSDVCNQSGFAQRDQINPTATRGDERRDEPGNGHFGMRRNATAVATITIGLIAGAASRNVRAAAGSTPRDETVRDRRRAAFTTGQHHSGEPRRRHGKDAATRASAASQRHRRDERGDRRADAYAEQ